jgi:hypothetical protein
MADAEHKRMTVDEYFRLGDAGIIGDKIELIDGRIVFGRFELAFSPAQRAAAEEIGIELPDNEQPSA